MQGFAQQKVDNGKLVKARVTFSDQIESVSFFGDFFLHPEDTLLELEKALVGVGIPLDSVLLQKKFETVLQHQNAQLIGATPHDLANIVLEAVKNAK